MLLQRIRLLKEVNYVYTSSQIAGLQIVGCQDFMAFETDKLQQHIETFETDKLQQHGFACNLGLIA